MNCGYTVVDTLYLFVTLLGIANGDVCYKAEFSEDVWSCADFDNDKLKCDPLELGMVEGKDGELGLNGKIDVVADIEDGAMMDVEVWKIMDIGKEYLYHAQGDICSSLNDDQTPWYPMISAMEIKACPIPAKTYDVKDMIINLEHAKNIMTHELCGGYRVRLSIKENIHMISCYELGVTVSEYEC